MLKMDEVRWEKRGKLEGKKSKQEKRSLGSKREAREHRSMDRNYLKTTMKVHKAEHLVSNFSFVLLKLLNLFK